MAATELVSKPGAKSPVWEYFGFEADDKGKPVNEDRPFCKKCLRTVATKSGNTSNLLSHLRNAHPEVYKRMKGGEGSSKTAEKRATGGQQQTLEGVIARSTPYARNSKRWEKLMNAITYCVAKDIMPLQSIEKPGFKQLIQAFDPQYEPPSRKYISNTAIPALYYKMRDKVASDLWSSNTMEPHMSYTIHYIGEDWKLHSRCLQTMFCPEDHTGENLSAAISSSLESWGLKQAQQTCLTTDNGANILRAVRILGQTHLPCFGHCLQLAITSATGHNSRVSRAYGLCRKIVGSFSHSWKDLAQAQDTMKLPQHMVCNNTHYLQGSC